MPSDSNHHTMKSSSSVTDSPKKSPIQLEALNTLAPLERALVKLHLGRDYDNVYICRQTGHFVTFDNILDTNDRIWLRGKGWMTDEIVGLEGLCRSKHIEKAQKDIEAEKNIKVQEVEEHEDE